MSVTLKPFESEIPLFQDTINFFDSINKKGRKSKTQTVYPYNDEGYILSFEKGVFNEYLKSCYAAKHYDKSDEEVEAYITNAKNEFNEWYNTEGKNLYESEDTSPIEIIPEENGDSEEPTIWDKIGDSFESGLDKVSDLICAPFNWMTDKLMDLTFR